MAARRSGTGWVAAYVGLLVLPLPLMALSPHQESTPSTVFAVAVGFAAYIGMALQVVIASRAPALRRAAGLDTLLRLHRYMGGLLLALVAVHVAVLAYQGPWFRPWLYPYDGPFVAQAGFVGAVGMILLGLTSYARRALRLSFERWRALHLVCTVAAIGGAYVHILMASDYSWSGPLRTVSSLAALAALAALVYLRVGRAFAAAGLPYELVAVRPERGDATTLELRAAGHDGIVFTPGQFAWLRSAGRPYTLTEHPLSVSSSTHDPRALAFTARHVGDHTSGFGGLEPGSIVLVDGPHGGRRRVHAQHGWVLVVAGIGVTPAMSVLRTMADAGDRRPVQLLYGVRDREQATFLDELEALRDRLDLDLHVVESRVHGRIDARLLASVLPPDRTERRYLLCGPRGFAEATLRTLVELGVPADMVQAERFDSV